MSREWTHRNQRDFRADICGSVDDQIGTKAGIGLASRCRQFDAGQTILAVPELRRDQLLIERVLRSAGHRKSPTAGCERH